MGQFVTQVYPRWSDMDVFRHVNHAAIVTLLEDARAELLFVEAPRRGLPDLAKGLVVAKLTVEYRTPLTYTGSTVRVELAVDKLRYASFVLNQKIYRGQSDSDEVVAVAEVLGVAYDTETLSPRRFSDAERDFLAEYQAEVNVG